MMWKLKRAILESGVRQYELARRAGLTETRVSRILLGRCIATDDEMTRIARALGASVSEVFGEGA